MKEVVFYSSTISPWGFLMMDRLEEWIEAEKIDCKLKIVQLPKLFSLNDNPPLNKRSAAKLNYRMQEIRRWKVLLGRPNFKDEPKHFPVDMTLSSKVVLAGEDEASKRRLLYLMNKGCWEDELNISDEGDILSILGGAGFDGGALLDKAKSDEMAKMYDEHTEDAIENLVFGVPTIRVDKEIFWGQDRLDLAQKFIRES